MTNFYASQTQTTCNNQQILNNVSLIDLTYLSSNNSIVSNEKKLIVAHQKFAQSTCTTGELYRYLLRKTGEQVAKRFLEEGKWPAAVQIPKNAMVLNKDGSIAWHKAPEGGYILRKDGTPLKTLFVPQKGEVVDRYGSDHGRYASPVKNGQSYAYTERSLPYVEEFKHYHQYQVIGDFSKLGAYIERCTDATLKAEVNATIMKRYHGDYRKLVNYQGKIAQVEGWGAGGGIQYEFPLGVGQLTRLGVLKEIR